MLHDACEFLAECPARSIRDALPNASFISFTGTPIEQNDANTRAVFGEYVSACDIQHVTATPDELAAHVCEAVQWAGTHRELNPANAIIIYAWNEHDEGGWLQPTRGADGKPDDSRIHALGKALRALQPPFEISKPR